MQAIAERGGYVLVQTGPEEGVVVNARKQTVSVPVGVESVLSHGYWIPFTGEQEPVLTLVSSALNAGAWDETKHPRHPSGSEAGGEFKSAFKLVNAGRTSQQYNADLEIDGRVVGRVERGWSQGGYRAGDYIAKIGTTKIATGKSLRELREDIRAFLDEDDYRHYLPDGDLTASTFVESQHPRHAKGRREGGRFRGQIGATPFRGGKDEPEGFVGGSRWKKFEQHVRDLAGRLGVTVDRFNPGEGYWEGEREPSASIDAHDGTEAVGKWAEGVRERWEQQAVVTFQHDEAGPDAMVTFGKGGEDAVATLKRAGVQAATITPDSTVLYLTPDEFEIVDKLGELGGYEVSRGRREFR